MKILLVQPPSSDPLSDRVFLFEPLGLEYLGAGLKTGWHEVEILDARLTPDMESACRRFQPQVVGITGYTSQLNIIRNMTRHLKAAFPELRIVVGGHHATVSPNDFNLPTIDAVVIGEGVFALREIVAAFNTGRSLLEIKGVAIPAEDSMRFGPVRSYTNLDDLPFPDRSLTAVHRQNYFSEWFKPLASLRTSLGCTGRCNFCALWSITAGSTCAAALNPWLKNSRESQSRMYSSATTSQCSTPNAWTGWLT